MEGSLLKNLKGLWSALGRPYPSNLLAAVFHKFYSVHSWTLCLKWFYHMNCFKIEQSISSIFSGFTLNCLRAVYFSVAMKGRIIQCSKLKWSNLSFIKFICVDFKQIFFIFLIWRSVTRSKLRKYWFGNWK